LNKKSFFSAYIQNDIGNAHSPTTIVTPLTRNLRKNPIPTHLEISKAIGLAGDSLILAEQIRAIDRSRLTDYVGHIPNDDDIWWEIEKALEISISIGIEKRRPQKNKMYLFNLCPNCARDFINSGHFVVKKGFQELNKDCDMCNNGEGFTFAVFNLYGRE